MRTQTYKTLLSSSLFLAILTAQAQSAVNKWQSALAQASEGAILTDNSPLFSLEGDTTHYSALKGEWLLLDYWSTSCLPCIVEMPHVKTLSEQYKGKGLKVVMINLDKSLKKWKRGISGFSPPEPNYNTNRDINNQFFAINLVELVDDKGKKTLSTLMPQYVLISPDGKIVNKQMPKPSKPEFTEKLEKYINQKR